MKHLINNTPKLFVALTLLVLTIANVDAQRLKKMSIQDAMPKANLKMEEINGGMYSLEDEMGKEGLVVIFSSCTCPFVVGNGGGNEGWETRYADAYAMAKKRGFGFVLINSNEKYRDDDESIEELKKQAMKNNYSWHYLIDKNNVVADAFGATTTPHVFVFDTDQKLQYVGAIDDNVRNSKEVKQTYLNDALSAMAKGETVTMPKTKNIGCSIKRI